MTKAVIVKDGEDIGMWLYFFWLSLVLSVLTQSADPTNQRFSLVCDKLVSNEILFRLLPQVSPPKGKPKVD